MPVHHKGKSGTRKYGRMRDRSKSHARYEASRRDLKNKRRKLARHIMHHPGDECAMKSWDNTFGGKVAA